MSASSLKGKGKREEGRDEARTEGKGNISSFSSTPLTSLETTGVSLVDTLAISSADNYLLQRQERWEERVSELLRSVDLLAREEEGTSDVNDNMVTSIEKLRQLNAALASAAKRQRDTDASQMKQTKTSLELQIQNANQSIARKSTDIERLTKKLAEIEATNREQEKEIVGLRGEIQTIRSSEATLRDDLNAMEKRAKRAEQTVDQLHNEIVSVRLEKDSVTQRFVELTKNLTSVAQGHAILNGSASSSASAIAIEGHSRARDLPRNASRAKSPPSKSKPAAQSTRVKRSRASRWGVRQVGVWLEDNGFGSFVGAFSKNSVDGEMLFDLTDDDLRALLGMGDAAQREALMCLRGAL